MAVSTKMRLHRKGDSHNKFWRYKEIVVDQAYLDAGHGMLVELDFPYIMGEKMLDVHFNGQYASEGGGYEEVDPLHIRLDIRDHDGNPRPLEIGDEIVIRQWLEPANPAPSPSQDDVRKLAFLLGIGNYDIDFEYYPDEEYVKKETIYGDYNVTREYVYTDFGKPEIEIMTYEGKQVSRQYTYDNNWKVTKVRVRTVII